MTPMIDDLEVIGFAHRTALRAWLVANHGTSPGVWVRIARRGSGMPSVSFEDVLEQGLCFGWSESQRIRGDEVSYLQRFTPRRRKGTASERNQKLVLRLIADGEMTQSGLAVLRMNEGGAPTREPDPG